ncbi:GNAT family N-acetyltransferase [Flagellimonas myxillae]|uniref:GNAT family N-acetyltransferase n=1 Tax=Flagellimonas myxillae TaxID=2942214 RepID=UPI00201F1F7B|nr:GNAT family N-acetyltransferase [Muricauda myxillae]MCL6266222.1 GNAT family N-acetyltransferase [Muricauda myxillae]
MYVNIGRNLTKGFYYTIDEDKVRGSNHVFLVRDIPTYFNVPEVKGVKKLKVIKVRQYNGYLTYLKDYSTLDDFILAKYNSSRRNVLRRRVKGLKGSFNIKTEVYFGDIAKETYDAMIDTFHDLLVKRFREKKTEYHILHKWDYFRELIYPMILNKEAVLLVTYENEKPIGIYLSICFNGIVSGAIPVFDTDYHKFALGNYLTLKMVEWSIENGMEIFDSSKGDYGEKERISDLKYSFEYHLLYNPRSVISASMAFGIASFFRLKQFLREKQIHSIYHNFKFKLNPNVSKENPDMEQYELVDNTVEAFQANTVTPINLDEKKYAFLRKFVFGFLYKSREHIQDITVYENGELDTYFVVGKDKMLEVRPIRES